MLRLWGLHPPNRRIKPLQSPHISKPWMVLAAAAAVIVVDMYSAKCNASNALFVPIALRKDEFSEPT